eukprot:14943924-Alexandrium_andersonii.AAC.1
MARSGVFQFGAFGLGRGSGLDVADLWITGGCGGCAESLLVVDEVGRRGRRGRSRRRLRRR